MGEAFTPTPYPRAAARSDTCTALRAAQGAEGLSATLGCVDGNLTAESPSRALGIQGEGQGVRPKALAECEGLPHRTSGTGR